METIEIQASIRSGGGKGAARSLRRQGKLPAILYGPKRETVAIQLDEKDFSVRVAAAEGSHLIRLQCPEAGVDGRLALVKEVQRDPVTDQVIHADLYEVDIHTKIRVSVPLHFVGRAVGVEYGGILQPIRRDVEVLCLPTDIPDFIEVDVSPLAIHETLHLHEITPPPGVEIPSDAELSIVTVLAPTVEEVPVAAEGAEAAPEEAAAPAPPAEKPES